MKNVDLWQRLLQAKEPHQVRFIWVKGHDGHPQNERCDELATSAADGMISSRMQGLRRDRKCGTISHRETRYDR